MDSASQYETKVEAEMMEHKDASDADPAGSVQDMLAQVTDFKASPSDTAKLLANEEYNTWDEVMKLRNDSSELEEVLGKLNLRSRSKFALKRHIMGNTPSPAPNSPAPVSEESKEEVEEEKNELYISNADGVEESKEEVEEEKNELCTIHADDIEESKEEEEDDDKVYPNQIAAGEKIFELFRDNNKYVILKAQMQSGKTASFLYAAALLLQEDFDKVVIICGSSENTLKYDMTNEAKNFDSSDFWQWYAKTHRETGIEMREKIHVVFRQSLLKFRRPEGRILWIWDESHYGQSKTQTVNKFMRKMGLSATGQGDANDDGILSVSATGFSEEIDNNKHKQNKKIVELKPGEGYIGVKERVENGTVWYYNTRSASEREGSLRNACMRLREGGRRNVGLVRVTKKTQEWVERICREIGIDFHMYDKDVSKECDINNWLKDETSEQAKQGPCIIMLKGLCRMGKRLNKHRVKFAMETSFAPKTDTILQSLLGRLCGYKKDGTSNDQLVIIPRNTEDNVERYVKGEVPENAMNVMKSRPDIYNTVPEKFLIPTLGIRDRRQFHALIVREIRNNSNPKNDDCHRENLLENVNDNYKFSDLTEDSFVGHEQKLEFANENGTILENPGSSCGVSDDEVRVWTVGNISDHLRDTNETFVKVFVQFKSRYPTKEGDPSTTGKEVFSPDI